MQFRNYLRATLSLLALVFATAVHAGLPRVDSMFVFGDSLSDTGNIYLATKAMNRVPALPPSDSPYASYWRGRFSNGPVAVESLWKAVRGSASAQVTPYLALTALPASGAVNFAFGGAGTSESNWTPDNAALVPGVRGQVGLFVQALGPAPAPANALYVVWGGGNDYLFAQRAPQDVVADLVLAIRGLYAKGARTFLVPNLPDLGLSQIAQGTIGGPAATQAARTHNALLAQAVNQLARTLPRSKFVQVDVFKLGEVMLSTGLVSTTPPALALLSDQPGIERCLFVDATTCVDVNLSAPLPPLLFWDALHPTTQVHALIAATMYTKLALSLLY